MSLNASLNTFSNSSGYTSSTSLCSSPVPTAWSSPSSARSSPLTSGSLPDFSSNVSGGYAYNQYPCSPFTSSHLPDSPQHIYPTSAPAPTTFDVEVERLKSHFTQREDTFRSTIAALLNKVASQQEIIKQNLACFTGAMKEQMQIREKVEQALQASTNAHREAVEARDECRLACSKVLDDNYKLRFSLLQSNNLRLKNENNFRDQLEKWSDKIVSQERLVQELENERKQTVDSFRDQLKSLSNRVASLEATVAPAPVAARELEDKINGKVGFQSGTNIAPVLATAKDAKVGINYKVDSQPTVIERVMYSDKIVPKSGSFDKMCLDLRKNMEEAIKRTFCRTRARGSMHLSGPCYVCGTKLPRTYAPESVT